MKNIAEKIKTLNLNEDDKKTFYKFSAPLTFDNPKTSEEIVSVEELETIKTYLEEKGIKIRPVHYAILANDFEYIKNIIETLESMGDLEAIIQDPLRINSKHLIERLNYIKRHEQEYRSPEGKYPKTISSKKAFESEYGIIDFDKYQMDYDKEDKKSPEEIVVPIIEENNPVSLIADTSNKDESKAKEPIKPLLEENVDNDNKKVVNDSFDDNFFSEVSSSFDSEKNSKEQDKEPVSSTLEHEEIDNTEFANEYEEILSKPQRVGLNDETFDRYEKLADSVRRVLISVYNTDELSDDIIDNLIKLVTAGLTNDKDIIYYSITYRKVLNEEEVQRIKSSIEEELEYTNILEIDLGGRAA